MNTKSILVAGLPGSGKTTFLAALWHLVSSKEIETALEFASLAGCDAKHINQLAARWRDVAVQVRTQAGTLRNVVINLKSKSNGDMRLMFPDSSGEDFREVWESRDCAADLAELITGSDSLLLFVHADKIEKPRWVFDEATIRKLLDLPPDEEVPIDWSPRLAPTQVQLVDLLQLFSQGPLYVGRRRLCLVLSAWDKTAPQDLAPRTYLRAHFPLLDQFLNAHPDKWDWIVAGVSAQGGDHSAVNEGDKARAEQETARLRAIDTPSKRIRVEGVGPTTSDLTVLIKWLVQ